MLPLFGMLNQSQNGEGMAALARQFNLSQQQAQAAVEALLPAFSQGLKRNTADPYGFGAFMSAMASGDHGKYFEDASRAFSPQGIEQGNDILGQLFGSKELSRAVASQAAQATGLGQQVLQQMLPVIATMIMGGLFKQTMNQMPGSPAQQAAGFGGANNPLGQIIEEMMKQSGGLGGGMAGGQPAPPRAPSPGPAGNTPFGNNPLGDTPFGKILQDMFGGQAPAPQGGGAAGPGAPPRPQNPLGDTPWGKILEDMLGGGQPGGTPEPQPHQAPEPQQAPGGSGPAKNPYGDIFGKMFETGRPQGDDYEKNVGTVFDQFLKGMGRNR